MVVLNYNDAKIAKKEYMKNNSNKSYQQKVIGKFSLVIFLSICIVFQLFTKNIFYKNIYA
jgi:hypothetical protein